MAGTSPASLAPRLRALLESLPDSALPITYQQAAEALGLTPPRTIRRVAEALEITMREDVAAERPLIAALVVSRQAPQLPGPGFFELAVALGRLDEEPTSHLEAYQRELAAALATRR
ncbi:MAG: hypothetical protein GYB17_10600 [Gammaproteobacteria bacterium]|uniref:hypothetical protein n=1 Tax=Halomonas sp. EF61 TaxID=2950869 RepID=UPI0032DF51CB|nr:hypothetical protein [Gammaproteobacteria bacterium]